VCVFGEAHWGLPHYRKQRDVWERKSEREKVRTLLCAKCVAPILLIPCQPKYLPT
jgi:hypothetical protein